MAATFGLLGLAAVATAGLGSLAVGWWSSPLDRSAATSMSRMQPLVFDARGVAVLGHALFAFVLGVTVGMLVRRSLATMALTLVGFVALQVAMPLLVRPHLATPVRSTVTVTPENLESLMSEGPDGPVTVTVKVADEGAWVLSNTTVDASGKEGKVPMALSAGPCPIEQEAGDQAPSASPRSANSDTSSRSPTTRRVASGRSSGGRPASTSPPPSRWAGSVTGVSAACPDPLCPWAVGATGTSQPGSRR